VSATAAPLDPVRLGQALAAVRIFFGLILFSNGLAKLLSFSEVSIGPYKATLIDRAEARSILEFEVNRRGGDGTDLPLLKSIVNDVMLANWGIFQWLTTALELGVGLALILGIATRGAALAGLAQQFFLQLVYFSSSRFMWEQPHEWVPLLILALVPAGRVWGLDARLVHRGSRRFDRWPF
jgi:thiosulfate dehydrogenase (quinone) large subunit